MEALPFSITKTEAGKPAQPSMFKIAQEIIQRTILDYDYVEFIVKDDNTLIISNKVDYLPNDFITTCQKVADFYSMRLWLTNAYHFQERSFELHFYR